MNKTIGYIIAAAGLAGLALTTQEVREALSLTLPEGFSAMSITIISIVLLGVGGFLAFKSGPSEKQPLEVPIYHGNKIVGYRRT